MMSSPNFPQGLAIFPSDGFGVLEQRRSIEKYGIAGRVWEAAYLMDVYVRGHLDWKFDPPFCSTWQPGPCTVLELGSGTGVVGSRIADAMGRSGKDIVIVTDLPEVCPLLEINLKDQLISDLHSEDGCILVRPLAWGNSEHAANIASELNDAKYTHPRFLTHIVCSDLVYFPELFAPLLRTLIQLTSLPFISSARSASDLIVFIAYKIRSLTKESPFWSAFGLWFSFEPVMCRQIRSGDNSQGSSANMAGSPFGSDTFIFIARRRPASFSWFVPCLDRHLLNGIGAYGTDVPKVDDTFETLLLMTMLEATNT